MDNPCQEALFRAMSKPEFYPHPVRYVAQKETHISKVFLTGDQVYKIKKKIDLGFLDFSNLAKRRRYCELEVALNRRLTDHVYLDVMPITAEGRGFCLGGSGDAVEFAVHMRQLPDACSLASLLKKDRVDIEQVEALALKLTDFYERQGSVAPEPAAAAWKNIKYACEENFRQTQWAAGDPLNSKRYHTVRSATRSFLTHRKALFDARIEAGKICDGHGDLRCGHVYYAEDDTIQVIDCIEFNTRLRYIDIASDLAFLAMDLDFRGYPQLGAALVDAYARKTGDWQIFALLPFYKCYRAMVRSKVNCIRLKENGHGGCNPRTLGRRADRYLSLAHGYAVHFRRPTIWVLCGLPAAGKSTIARVLSQAMATTVLRSDVSRKQLFQSTKKEMLTGFDQGNYNPAAHRLTYHKLLQLARDALDQENSIILDATFSHPEQRRQLLQLAADRQARAVFVECTAPDHVLKARLLRREGLPSASDARRHHFDMLKQRYLPMDEVDQTLRLRVDTSQPIHDCIDAIMSWDHMAALTKVYHTKKPTASADLKGGSHVQDHSGSNGPSHGMRSFGGNGSPDGRREPRPAFHPPCP